MSAGLILKNEKGWFAAGAEVEKALEILSDGAFKLFIHLCLLARRDQGVLQVSQLELAKNLKKGTQTIRHYLQEMERSGICRLNGFEPKPFCRGLIEITDEYWPYERLRSPVEAEAGDEFAAAIRRLLDERACVRKGAFSTADAILARQWLARGVTLEQVEHAILLGCSRKYVAWRNHQGQAPIASLRYFEPVLEELEQISVSPLYWDYIRSRMERIEKLWIRHHQGQRATENEGAIP